MIITRKSTRLFTALTIGPCAVLGLSIDIATAGAVQLNPYDSTQPNAISMNISPVLDTEANLALLQIGNNTNATMRCWWALEPGNPPTSIYHQQVTDISPAGPGMVTTYMYTLSPGVWTILARCKPTDYLDSGWFGKTTLFMPHHF